MVRNHIPKRKVVVSQTIWEPTGESRPSKECVVCSSPIKGRDADVFVGRVTFLIQPKYIPDPERRLSGSIVVPLIERVRRHFLKHEGISV